MHRVLHVVVLGILLGQAAYCAVQVFVFLQPPGHAGPLFGLADDVPVELLVARRLYAIEGWIAFGFACLYLAILEGRRPRTGARSSATRIPTSGPPPV